METIERSERLGWALLAVSMVLAALTAAKINHAKKETWASIWLGALLVSHPGWWMSARHGDCGTTRLYTSIGATAAMATLSLVVMMRARASR